VLTVAQLVTQLQQQHNLPHDVAVARVSPLEWLVLCHMGAGVDAGGVSVADTLQRAGTVVRQCNAAWRRAKMAATLAGVSAEERSVAEADVQLVLPLLQNLRQLLDCRAVTEMQQQTGVPSDEQMVRLRQQLAFTWDVIKGNTTA
jgi:hypothetical protein